MSIKSLKVPIYCTLWSKQNSSGATTKQVGVINWNLTNILPKNTAATLRWKGIVTSSSPESQWEFLTYKIGNASGTVSIAKNSRNVTVPFSAKHKSRQGATSDDGHQKSWSATLKITQAVLTYGGSSTGGTKKKQQTSSQYNLYDFDIPGQFPRKNQIAYIIDKGGGPNDTSGNASDVLVKFDGVIKCSVSSQIKTDDQKNHEQKKNNKYINNAMDQPDQITLDIVESAVYTNQSFFEGGQTDDRMMFTYNYLYQLKKARRMVDVWTGIRLYQNMLLKSISVTLDENSSTINNQDAFTQRSAYLKQKQNAKEGETVDYNHNSFLNGWAGQLTFHQFWKPITDDDEDTSGTDTDRRSQSAKILGDNFF